jgi:hypothetical protein
MEVFPSVIMQANGVTMTQCTRTNLVDSTNFLQLNFGNL